VFFYYLFYPRLINTQRVKLPRLREVKIPGNRPPNKLSRRPNLESGMNLREKQVYDNFLSGFWAGDR